MDARATVLIAEDDPLSRHILERLLAPDGYRVAIAPDGPAALEEAQKILPDVILLDVMMPGLDGFEVCRRLRSDARLAEVPVLMVTSLSQPGSRLAGIEAGADDFITKPYDPIELRARVRTITRLNRFRRLVREQERYARLAELSPYGILVTDSEGTIWMANQAFLRLVDAAGPEQVVGKNIETFVVREERERCAALWASVLAGRTASAASETEFLKLGGAHVPVVLDVGRLGRGGSEAAQFIVRDISERKRYQAQLERSANYDDLTGIPNRNLLRDRLARALSVAHKSDGMVAVALLNLDRFRLVNESLGHVAGDTLLKAAALRLGESLNAADTLARFGANVFAIVHPEIISRNEAAFFARSVLDGLRPPFHVDGKEIFVTGSMGVSLYPRDAEYPESLLKNAEAAMFRAREAGGDRFGFYAREMQAQALSLLETESALRRALERDELVLHYQPKVDLATGRIVGAECLIRWQRTPDELISPAQFIPLAEQTGLIVPIGEWTLRTACRQYKAWQDAGLPVGAVSVNVSARQFREPDLPDMAARVLAETGFEPRALELELTESTMMHDPQGAADTLRAIKALGPSVSLDDFGTGYSSLSYLRDFRVDTLKIDQSFVRNVTNSRNHAAIALTIIRVAKALGHKVVAEGGETWEQMSFLRANDCDQMQGYYFSKPLPAAEFEAFVRSGPQLSLVAA